MQPIPPDNIFFTADTHFGHVGIIKYCGRPFDSTEAMDQHLIDQWNSVVPPDGVVYHIGDFAFGKPVYTHSIIDQLNGDIVLIEGNHDRNNLTGGNIRKRFKEITPYMELKVREPKPFVRRITMCHYGLMTWRGRWSGHYHLHGHSHGGMVKKLNCQKCGHEVSPPCRRLDVGTDCHNYTPLTYQQIKDILDRIPYEHVDE